MTTTVDSTARDAAGSSSGWDTASLRTLIVVCTAHWLSHFHIMVLPPLLKPLQDKLGVGFVELGLALTVFSVVSGLTQAPVGFLTDRYGPQRMLTMGLCLGGAAFALIGFGLSYPVLLAGAALAGLANSVYHPCDYALLSASMSENRMGRAFSIHTFAGYLGGAVAPAILLVLVAYVGLQWTLVVAGLIGPLCAILVATTHIPLRTGAAQGPGAKSGQTGGGKGSVASVLNAPILVLTAFFVLISLSNGGIGSFSVVALMAGHGVGFETANVALTAFLGAGAVGVLTGGLLADRTSRHGQVAAACFAANACLVAILALASPPGWAAAVILGLAGFLGGIIAPSRDMLVRKAAPPGAAGRAFGIVSTGFNIGGIVAPMMYGFIMDHGWARGVFGTAVAFMLIAVLLTLATDRWLAQRERATAGA